MPLFELAEWSDFANFAPKGAKWVAIEFGGTPLEDFEHPPNAVYLLLGLGLGLGLVLSKSICCRVRVRLSHPNPIPIPHPNPNPNQA